MIHQHWPVQIARRKEFHFLPSIDYFPRHPEPFSHRLPLYRCSCVRHRRLQKVVSLEVWSATTERRSWNGAGPCVEYYHDAPQRSGAGAAGTAGATASFDRLVARHRAAVLHAAYALLGHWELAEDVAQQTFVQAFMGLPGLRDAVKFRPWLMTIMD